MAQYFSLPLLGAGTVEVEHLRSYFYRLAAAHCVSPLQLIKHIASWYAAHEQRDIPFRTYTLYAGHQYMFGHSASVGYSISVLEAATGQKGLKAATLYALHGIADQFGHSYLSKYRSWCPACFTEDMKNGIPYDRLLWAVFGVHYCSIHKLILVSQCPHCDAFQYKYKNGLAITQCATCQGSLVSDPNEWLYQPDAGHANAEVEQLIALVAACPDVEFDRTGVRQFFNVELVEFFGQLRHKLGPLRSCHILPSYRVRGRQHQTLQTMCYAARAVGIPLTLILQEPQLATKLLISTCFYDYYAPTNRRLWHTPHGRDCVKASMEQFLRDIASDDRLSLRTLLKSLGVSKGYANYWFPELCREIAAAQRQAAKKRRRHQIESVRSAIVTDGLLQAYQRGVITSQDKLVSLAVRASHASTSLVRRELKDILAGDSPAQTRLGGP